MNQAIYNYLKKYDSNILSINRLLVSAFINIKNIKVKNNTNIKSLIIREDIKQEFQKLQEFTSLINKVDKKFCFEELLELFEFVISPSDKLINGAIYTPSDIRKYITNKSFEYYKKDIENTKIVDISCGCGGFLIDAIKILRSKTNKSYTEIYKDNIFGVDIQEYSIERTKILLSLLAIENGEDKEDFVFNLYTKNSLSFNWKEEINQIKENDGFDIILGNPPYVCLRNMDDETKELMKIWDTCSTGHPDLYIPFFEIGYKLLNENGILGYITVNSFIKSVNGRAIRKFFQEEKVDLKIIDFEDEQIFNSRMTYTSICFISKNKSENIEYINLSRNDLKNKFKFEEHKYKDIDTPVGWYIKNRILVKNIESIGTPFGQIYNTKSGIATLKNSVYIFKPIYEDENYYFIEKNIKIEKNLCRNIVNSNFLVKTGSINNLMEKIIFPYYYDKYNKVHIVEEDDLINKYPYAYKYLLSNKEELSTRDKGKGRDYKYWYAFGRNQSLERTKYKLLFPQLAKEGFQSYISEDQDLYFYNGMAAMSNNREELEILQQIFKTKVFWLYVKSISKPYASNYISLGRNYMKNFGVSDFSEKEKNKLLKENNLSKLNLFINKKYNID